MYVHTTPSINYLVLLHFMAEKASERLTYEKIRFPSFCYTMPVQ